MGTPRGDQAKKRRADTVDHLFDLEPSWQNDRAMLDDTELEVWKKKQMEKVVKLQQAEKEEDEDG